jgi:hypothetical protein
VVHHLAAAGEVHPVNAVSGHLDLQRGGPRSAQLDLIYARAPGDVRAPEAVALAAMEIVAVVSLSVIGCGLSAGKYTI